MRGRQRTTRGVGSKWGLALALIAIAVLVGQVLSLGAETDWSALIGQAKPAVVWILAETSEGTSAGSGTIISPDGYIITAAHVIEGTSKITVVVEESREYSATITKTDYDMDVALLKIPASGLTWLALGDSDEVQYDEEIRVLGYPLPGAGVGFIAVAGKIQGFRVRSGVRLLQHDAPTEGGHSGGTVIDDQGKIIAVHTSWIGGEHSQYTLGVAINSAKGIIPSGVLPSGPSPVQPPASSGVSTGPIRVPQDCPDLAAAVQSAAEGTEIQVARGTYRGDISITKSISITGESGAMIEGAVMVSAARNVTLSGLQIRGGVGIRDTVSFILDRIVITGSAGDGVVIEASTGVITGCTIEDSQGAGVVVSFGSQISVTKTTICRNEKAGIALSLGAQARIAENTIELNQGDGIVAVASHVDLADNIIRDNAGCGICADSDSTITGSVTPANTSGNQGGNLCGTAVKFDTEPPAAPLSLSIFPDDWTNNSRFTVDWTNPAAFTGISVIWYKLGAEPRGAEDGLRTTSKPIAIESSLEGSLPIFVWLEDGMGKKSELNRAQGLLLYDRTPPTGSPMVINNADGSTCLLQVTLNTSATDSGGSGVSSMHFSNDGQDWSPWEAYSSARCDWDLSTYGGSGQKGPQIVFAQFRDRAGNVSSPVTATIDLLPCSTPLPAPQNLMVTPTAWTNVDSFIVDWDDISRIPIRVAAWYKLGAPPEGQDDGTRTTEKPFEIQVLRTGEHSVYIWLEDMANQKDHRNHGSTILRYDNTPPELTLGPPQGTLGQEDWYRSNVTVPFAIIDSLSGLPPDGCSSVEGSKTSSGEGTEVWVGIGASDLAGNATETQAGPFRVDLTPPTVTAKPDRFPDQDNWYNSDVIFAFECNDSLSGIASCTQPVTVGSEGRDLVIEGEAEDKAGNRTEATATVSLDKTSPTGSISIVDAAASTTSATVTLRIQANDSLSGVSEMRFSNNRSTWTEWDNYSNTRSWNLVNASGERTVFAQVRDRAGNVSQVFAATIELTLARTLVHDENIGSMAFSPDGSMIASCGVDITLWSIATGTVVRTIEVMGGPHAGSVAISPDGSLIVGGEEHVTVWDMTTGREVYTLEAWKTDIKTGLAGGTVLSKAFSPDGKLLALGHINYVIGIWDVATGGLVRTLRGETLAVRSVAFSPDGRLLASGTRSSTIRLWEVATGRLVRTLTFREDTGVVTTVAFSPDGSLLASGGSESWKSGEGYDRGLIRFHDVTTGRELRTIEGDPEQIMSIAFSLDGRLLASGGSYYWDEANRIRRAEIKLWDVTTGHLVRTLQGHTGDIRSLVFSPDGRLLASGSNDRTIKLWDLSDLTGQGS